ncbi:MAG: mandelate racemase/muconate lactonizing enzyme family protein [Alphaproteobacteria bacterium]|nr:mandelate racemase/muconate lactonizing enzyme family protein [Alphaproteobacteria bacterium]
MKISAIELERLAIPLRKPIRTSVHDFTYIHTVLVRLRTDAGLTGMGWCFAFEASKAAALAALVEDLATIYQGRDPRAVRANFAAAWRDLNFLGHAGAAMMALSSLDTACWDLAAQAAELPLYRYLGGDSARVTAYASSGLWLNYSVDEVIAEAEAFYAQGHRAMKMRIGRPDFMTDIDRVSLVREAMGSDIELLVDVNQAWPESVAIRAGRLLEALDIFWLEEPVYYADLDGCARVTAALDMRVATGETSYGSASVKQHLDARAADVLMPDLQRMGGITEYLNAATLCAAYNQPVSSHLFTEASAHVLAAQPHALMLEHMEWWEELFENPLAVEEGQVVMSDRPGLGLTLSVKALTQFAA